MRLTPYETQAIRNGFTEVFNGGKIILFGSRVDDDQKGGDIDLYLVLDQDLQPMELQDKKLDFLVRIKKLIGDQKIDVVVARDPQRLIEQEALTTGVSL